MGKPDRDVFNVYIATYLANIFPSPNLHLGSFSHKSKPTSDEHKEAFDIWRLRHPFPMKILQKKKLHNNSQRERFNRCFFPVSHIRVFTFSSVQIVKEFGMISMCSLSAYPKLCGSFIQLLAFFFFFLGAFPISLQLRPERLAKEPAAGKKVFLTLLVFLCFFSFCEL